MSTRIHIVGSGPRCGTTLLFHAMKVCFNIDSASDREQSICVSNTALGGGKIVLSKYPSEMNIVNSAMHLNKNLYVICIIRDPRDMVVSFHGGHEDAYWASLRYWTMFLKYYNKLVSNKRFIVVKYEDLTENPDSIQDYIVDKITCLESKYKFSEYHLHTTLNEQSNKAMHGLRPIESKGVESWKKHLPRIKQQITIHGDISNSLIQFGYQKDKEWLESLENQDSINFETKTGEFFTKKRLKGDQNKKLLTIANTFAENIHLNPEAIYTPLKFIYRKFIKR
jgi:hypothetical protein